MWKFLTYDPDLCGCIIDQSVGGGCLATRIHYLHCLCGSMCMEGYIYSSIWLHVLHVCMFACAQCNLNLEDIKIINSYYNNVFFFPSKGRNFKFIIFATPGITKLKDISLVPWKSVLGSTAVFLVFGRLNWKLVRADGDYVNVLCRGRGSLSFESDRNDQIATQKYRHFFKYQVSTLFP